MPGIAAGRLRLICAVLAVMMVLAAPLMPAGGAVNARLNPDEAGDDAPFVTGISVGEVSLTGFHCSIISDQGWAEFAADPGDIETLPTIGLELVPDNGGHPQFTGAGRAALDEMPAEVKNPLSTRLSRIIVGRDSASLNDGGEMQDVSLPEASMSVADLIGSCHP
jgi:hypothetical protein